MADPSPPLPPRCYLACAEPSWATTVPAPQLAGLLNLCCLFAPLVYVSDVHLGDNAGFLQTYVARDRTGLYERLRALAELGYVRLLLRDASWRPEASEPQIACGSFADVYASWIEQDPSAAWINPEITEARDRYFEDLDSWADDRVIDRYSYRDVKERFMGSVRRAYELASEGHVLPGLDALDPRTHRLLREVTARDWFSLSDVYRVLHEAGVASEAPVLRYHGLINELAYAEMVSGAVAGVDTAATEYERLLWAERSMSLPDEADVDVSARENVDELLSRAREVLTAPDLSILGVVEPEEIAALRAGGRSYFDLMKLAQDELYAASRPELEDDLFRATRDYWAFICDQVARRHPAAAKRPTRLGIFLGRLPAPMPRIGQRAFGFALNVGTRAITSGTLSPATDVLAAEAVKEARRSFSLRFLIVTERAEMKRMRGLVPSRGWVSTHPPKLYLPRAE